MAIGNKSLMDLEINISYMDSATSGTAADKRKDVLEIAESAAPSNIKIGTSGKENIKKTTQFEFKTNTFVDEKLGLL